MKKILTYKGAVMTWECDSNRHMNVMYYVNKFEHAGRNFSMELDLHDYETSESTGMVVLEQKINYLREVFEDNLLYVESTLLGVGNKTFTVLHEMYRNPQKELVAKMELVLVLFDKVHRKALPFPKDRKEALLKMLED